MRDAARQLADRLQLLRLAQLLLGIPQTRLLPQPFGHVVDELKGPDALAHRVPEHAEAHLVRSADPIRVAELSHCRIGSTLDGGLPCGLYRGLMLGLVGEHLQHALPDLRSHAEDALELFRGGAIDRQPAIIEIGDLNEGVGVLDDVRQHLTFGDGGGDPPFQRLVELSQRQLGPTACGNVGKQHGHTALPGFTDAERVHIPPPPERSRPILKPHRLAGSRHTAIGVEPVLLMVRHQFAHTPTHGIGEPALQCEMLDSPPRIRNPLECHPLQTTFR